MNNWIQAHKVKVLSEHDPYWGEDKSFEAIPVSALEELFSKDGEQLARDYAVSMGFKLELVSGGDIMRSFLEGYNLKEVKIAELKKEVEELREQIAALKEGFEGDEHLEHD
jgi:hypothetical protein